MTFQTLGLSEQLLQTIEKEGYQHPTPIQEQAIPQILAGGDLIAQAQTGTGKTAAFALPILQKLSQRNFTKVRPIRALVLAPTRELTSQVGGSFKTLGAGLTPKLRCVEVFGGVKIEAQEHKLKLGCDILVATPGRLLDLIKKNIVRLNMVEVLVLDEGDRLLEMGFMPDIRNICSLLPAHSQKLMFSATFSEDIDRMAAFLLRKPNRVTPPVTAVSTPKIRQIVHCIQNSDKLLALRSILDKHEDQQALVFVNTRLQTAEVSRALGFAGYRVGCIHGDVDQKGRTKVLADFVSGAHRILVATDVAARGLHIPDLPLVINFEIPQNTDDYTHRIGRTGRSGQSGKAISLASPGEMATVEIIEEQNGEKMERQKIAGFRADLETRRKRKEELEVVKPTDKRAPKGAKARVAINSKSSELRGKKSQKTAKSPAERGRGNPRGHGRTKSRGGRR